MKYLVIETLPAQEADKPVKIVTEFENEDILAAKEEAEAYFIKKWVESPTGKVALRFKLKSVNEIHFLSEDYQMEGAKTEAERITELTGIEFKPVTWPDRHQKLITAYKKSNS